MTDFVCKSGCNAGYTMDFKCNRCLERVVPVSKLSPSDMQEQMEIYRLKIRELEEKLNVAKFRWDLEKRLDEEIEKVKTFVQISSVFRDRVTSLKVEGRPLHKLDSKLSNIVKAFDDERRKLNS